MAESLLVGAALKAAFGELLKAVLETKDKALKFKPTLEYLTTTLNLITPVIKEIDRQNYELGRPKEELEYLIRKMEEGTKLVYKCSRIGKFGFCDKSRHQDQLAALVESLMMFFIINMQAQISRDMQETLLEVRRMHSTVNKQSSFRTGSYSDQVMEDINNLSQKLSQATNRGSGSSIYEGHLSYQTREEPLPYSSPVIQRYESFEKPIAWNGSQSFCSQDDKRVSLGNPQYGIALYNFTAEGHDKLSLTIGEELQIEYEVDNDWFYVKKKRPGRDGKMDGLVPILYVKAANRGSGPSIYEGLSYQIREEPPLYYSPVTQRYESFENPLAWNGSQSFCSQEEKHVSHGNPQFGIVLYNFTAEGHDELSLIVGEELQIEYQANDDWFYVTKKYPDRDGKMAGHVPVLYVKIIEGPPPYSSPVMQRYESFESPLVGYECQSFGSQYDEWVSSGNLKFGIALYDFKERAYDELSLTVGEELEIEYEVGDYWFYAKKKRPGMDGKMAGLVPISFVSQY